MLIILGLGLSGAMAWVSFYLYDVIAHQDLPGGGGRSRWAGGPEFTRTVFELFGAVFLFGLVSMATGAFQVRTGRRPHPVLLALMFLLVAVMVYLGYRIIISAGQPDGP